MQLEAFLEASARSRPEKTALVCGSRRLTYAELERASNRVAHGLLAEGIQRGDRVALYLENSVEAVVGLFATLKAGAVFLMVNPTTKAAKLRYVLNNSRAHTIVLPGRKGSALAGELANTPHLECVVTTGPTPPPDAPALARKRCVAFDDLEARHAGTESPPKKHAIDIDLAALIYTSGSTGSPKGVMLTHRNMVSAATSITTYLENTPEDILLSVLPLSFDYGLYQVLMAARIGGTLVLERSFAYPHAVLEKLVSERATGFPLVPTMSAMLLQRDLERYDLRCLRYITNTGAALPTDHITRLRRLLPNVQLYSMYGLTECKRVAYLPPDQVDQRPDSVGKAMPNTEVILVDDAGLPVSPGTIGELVVRGSNVMQGYWEMPEETDKVLKPGRLPGERVLYSGDLFRADDEGYLYFISRKDDIIKSRGEKVSPKEVENVLASHPGVAEAAVVGVPDAILGQAVKAIVKPRDGREPTERELMRYCAERLEDLMVPKIVEFRTVFPTTTSGKVDKREMANP